MKLSKADFIDVLQANALIKEKELELLTIIYSAESFSATAPEITKAFGYTHFVTVNSLVGRLGKKIAEFKQVSLRRRRDGTDAGWDIIFDGKISKRGFVWTLKAPLKEAMDELGLDPDIGNNDYQDDFSSPFFEGSRKIISVNSYERNKAARQVCTNHYGAICTVCAFDFKKTYGVIGENYIHIHHTKPLSTINQTYEVDPINDLIPVCPNCHAMIHRRKAPYTVEELKEIMRDNQ